MYKICVNYSFEKYGYVQTDLGRAKYVRDKCTECGRFIDSPSFTKEKSVFIVEGVDAYPDFIYYCCAGTRIYVSKRVKDVLSSHNITGYEEEEFVEVYRQEENNLEKKDIGYYSIKVTGVIDFDLKSMQLKKKRICSHCKQFDWSRQRLNLVKTAFDAETWDNSDLCSVKSSPGIFICTPRLKQIIEENGFTGVEFTSDERVFGYN